MKGVKAVRMNGVREQCQPFVGIVVKLSREERGGDLGVRRKVDTKPNGKGQSVSFRLSAISSKRNHHEPFTPERFCPVLQRLRLQIPPAGAFRIDSPQDSVGEQSVGQFCVLPMEPLLCSGSRLGSNREVRPQQPQHRGLLCAMHVFHAFNPFGSSIGQLCPFLYRFRSNFRSERGAWSLTWSGKDVRFQMRWDPRVQGHSQRAAGFVGSGVSSKVPANPLFPFVIMLRVCPLMRFSEDRSSIR